jgi:hypothetical protein
MLRVATPPLDIHFTKHTKEELASRRVMADPRYGGDPEGWHKNIVKEYAKQNGITRGQRVNIRCAIHEFYTSKPN